MSEMSEIEKAPAEEQIEWFRRYVGVLGGGESFCEVTVRIYQELLAAQLRIRTREQQLKDANEKIEELTKEINGVVRARAKIDAASANGHLQYDPIIYSVEKPDHVVSPRERELLAILRLAARTLREVKDEGKSEFWSWASSILVLIDANLKRTPPDQP